MPPVRRSLHPADAPSDRPSSRPSSRKSTMDPPRPLKVTARAGPASSPHHDHVVLPKTCTPGYIPPTDGAGDASGSWKGKEKDRGNYAQVVVYSDEAKDRLLQEILGFHPRTMLENIAEVSRKQIYDAVARMETHLNRFIGLSGANEEDEGREIEIGLHSLETLLESHMDSALDKLIGWALRNTFNVKDGMKYTLPWQEGLDFQRGQYVQTLPNGDATIEANLETLRAELEDLRKVDRKLRSAHQSIDEKLKVAERRRAEISFVRNQQEYPHLAGQPLPTTASTLKSSLLALHLKLQEMEIPLPPNDLIPALPTTASPNEGVKEWEMGRAAYLNWATRTVVGHAEGGAGADGEPGVLSEREEKRLFDQMTKEKEQVGGDVQGLTKMGAGLR